jgi:16S rRNA C967 or C1407 C5-methylase (RsmB/RsmF family)/NOL1/NOP2/fmu family ribosome biogenesis protein
MMQLPEQLLNSLESVKGFDKEAFENVHSSGEQITSIRLNPFKESTQLTNIPINQLTKIPWTDYGYYLDQRPSFTFDPLFHAGTYYVQEASSMFLEQALKQTVDLTKSLKVLDLCASPGGKSTHIQSLISKDSLLVSNDVIRSRANVLKDNIIKWGCENVMVTNNDPKDFTKLENYFDVIVVDAPCSGSGLFRRDAEAIEEWSANNVILCSQRQQRILADVWPALKKDGILIYSTCSYSKKEDEEIMDWMMTQLSVVSCQLTVAPLWGITPVQSNIGAYGYKFWPDKVKGEGFFLACFKKTDGENDDTFRYRKKPEAVTKKEMEFVEKWVKTEGKEFIKYENTVYAWPEDLSKDFSFLLEQIRVIYSGVLVGELMRDKLVPDHALAMSQIVADNINRFDVNKEQAIQYLQRKDLKSDTMQKGWGLIEFERQPLGWANILPNRINNYYPKSLRILKESPD